MLKMMRWALAVSVLAWVPVAETSGSPPARSGAAPSVRTTKTVAARPQVRAAKSATPSKIRSVRTRSRPPAKPEAHAPVARPTKALVATKAGRKPMRLGKRGRARPRVAFVPCSSALPDQAPAPVTSGRAPKAGMDALVAERTWLWPNGATINVHFVDGTEVARNAVAEVASAWTKHANLKFRFFAPDAPPATTHIRVTFQDPNCNSALGTSSQYMIESGDASMRLCHMDAWVGTEAFERVVTHEFGHAIGMHHEHQSPKAKFDWNKPFVYEYYRSTVGWDASYVDQWVFRQIDPSLVDASEYDPDSVMQYSFPAQFTTSGKAIEGSHRMSKTDEEQVAKLYPKTKTKTKTTPKPAAKNVKFHERTLAIRNETGETVDVRFAVQTKRGDKWVWEPGADAGEGTTVRLTAGEERVLPGAPKGRRLRFVARSTDGARTWTKQQKRSLVTAPAGGYTEREIQTFVAALKGPPDPAKGLDREALYAAASEAYTSGDRELARARFGEFVERFPEDPWRPWAELNVASSWIDDGRWRDALLASYALIESDPDADASGYAWFYGGIASLHLGNCDDARAWFDYVAEPQYGLPAEWQTAAREYLQVMKKKPKQWCG